MATCGTVRDMNLSRMREYVLLNRKVRIADAARDTGMSIPTAAKLIGDLVESGEMTEVGCCASTGGRCAVLYEINRSYLSYLLLRIDGDSVSYQARDYAGECIESGSFEAVENLLGKIDDLVLDIRARFPNLRGVYLGAAAHVKDGRIEKESSTPALQELNVHEHFHSLAQIPAYVENDTNLVASGCWKRSGLNQGCIVCLHLTSDTQFSAGLVINGRTWEGSRGLSGEVHMMHALRIAHERYHENDLVSYCAFMVGMYAVTVDPDRVTLYQPRDHAPIDPEQLRALCEKGLSAEYVPQIDVSGCWDSDYWLGLDMKMRGLLGIG